MILAILLACASDVSIIKRPDVIVDTESSVVDSANPEPSGEPATEPDPERSGISGYTYFHLRQVACPACMGESQEITITFSAEFHQPSSDGHTNWIPQVGQCTTNLIGTDPSTIPINVGSSIMVNNPAHSFSVPAMGEGFYWTTSIWESQLQRDAFYTVQTEAGSYGFFSSHGFDFIEPNTMLFVDPS